MKILRIATYWSTEEAECVYHLLDEIKVAVWAHYGQDILNMHHEQQEQQSMEEIDEELNDDIPF